MRVSQILCSHLCSAGRNAGPVESPHLQFKIGKTFYEGYDIQSFAACETLPAGSQVSSCRASWLTFAPNLSSVNGSSLWSLAEELAAPWDGRTDLRLRCGRGFWDQNSLSKVILSTQEVLSQDHTDSGGEGQPLLSCHLSHTYPHDYTGDTHVKANMSSGPIETRYCLMLSSVSFPYVTSEWPPWIVKLSIQVWFCCKPVKSQNLSSQPWANQPHKWWRIGVPVANQRGAKRAFRLFSFIHLFLFILHR